MEKKNIHAFAAKEKRTIRVRTFIFVLLSILSILPFYLMFINASRTSMQVQQGVSFLPGTNLEQNLETFAEKQKGTGITAGEAMLNSLIIAVPYTILSVYFSTLTAYGLYAYDFKGKKLAWGFIMAIMMVPTQVFSIGFYRFMIRLGLLDTYWPLILPAVTTPTVIYFMRQYMKAALPMEIVEASRIDGSGEFRTFNRVILPMMKPALATQAIFQFVACWNTLFMPSMIITSSNKKTITMFIQMLMGDSFRTDYGVVFLALSITILPMFVIYFIFSRFIVEGVSLGGVKE